MQTADQLRRADSILYSAVLVSHAVYAGLVLYLSSQRQPGAEPTVSLAIPLCAIAIAAAGGALAIDSVGFRPSQISRWIDAAKQESSDREVLIRNLAQRTMSTSIMRWALTGMASLMGVMASMLGSLPQIQSLMLVALGALTHLYCRPKLGSVIDQLEALLPPARNA